MEISYFAKGRYPHAQDGVPSWSHRLMDGMHKKHAEQPEPKHHAHTMACLLLRAAFPRSLEWAQESNANTAASSGSMARGRGQDD